MKKLLILLLLIGGVASAAHTFHLWNLDGSYENEFGQLVCTWVCRAQYPHHYAVTKGYGVCPRPR